MQKLLIVHGRDGCPDCTRLKAWMDRRKIEYEYRPDLTKDQIAPMIFWKLIDGTWLTLMGLEDCLRWLRIKYEN